MTAGTENANWEKYQWSLVPGPNQVRLPLDGRPPRGWEKDAASRLLPSGTPKELYHRIAKQLAFFLKDSRKRGSQVSFALVLSERPDTVASLTEMSTYKRAGQSVEEAAEWLLTNLHSDQDKEAVRPPVRERVELPAGPAIRMRGTYPESRMATVERVVYAILPPQIGEMVELSTTWMLPELSDELASRAEELARSFSVQPVQ